ncbi:uncharacterized protein LAESUDRAFT_52045 [Laetiporus sulphureus 93-53]|uniref:Copper homeostasis protein cutC homolog n=1 Tax=Laetiporus sulphureus 93-53 TaxID=1314785 RepID=A0A165FBP8_9APHY|nr:uncharacterized protein LAESUDRAFT_52045 [Laetiporus sulphureus 93-53]KZT08725.1 hypothetical protein LAESUDRAFT_52045 [Laetiporus sulphureus 93-53]
MVLPMSSLRQPERYLAIEVCIDSVESAISAVRGGADRLELCGNLALGGGTTPSLGLFKMIRQATLNVPVMVMIRPRTGDFCYTEDEVNIMIEDIRVFKEEGASGIVFGILTKEGSIDTARTTRLARVASPMQVCFHRAFDMTPNLLTALHDVRTIPHITRILTSGGSPTIDVSTLQTILQAASDSPKGDHRSSPTILPVSGINASTVKPLLDALLPTLSEIHLSAGRWIPSKMEYHRDGMGMGIEDGEWAVWRTSEEHVREVRRIVDSMCTQDAQGMS